MPSFGATWGGFGVAAAIPEIERFSELIGDIYDASLDPGLWPAVFAQVCAFICSSAAHLFVQDAVSRAANSFFAWGDNPHSRGPTSTRSMGTGMAIHRSRP